MYGGEDPYRLHHGLDSTYHDREGRYRPPHPDRVKTLVYAFAATAFELNVKLHGGSVPKEK